MARDDAELLRCWRDGDLAAGNELVCRLFPIVYRFFANKVSSSIEDLVQSTFAACVESKDRLPDRDRIRAYVLGIARHQLYAHFRRKREWSEIGDDELTAQAVEGSPSRVVAAREEHRTLLVALRALPLEAQVTLELYYWEGLRTAEVAEILGVEVSTIRARLTRARQLLKAQILRAAGSAAVRESTVRDLERWARSLRDVVDARGPAS